MPPELLNNDPHSYAWGVWHDRTPKLIAQIRDAHPYEAAQRAALDALGSEVVSGVITPVPGAQWEAWSDGHFGQRWLDAPFLWSESYFYRRLLDAVGFFGPGPWGGVDPFVNLKAAELRTAEIAGLPDEGLPGKLLAALWGNRADLGFRVDREPGAAHAELVVDDTSSLLAALAAAESVVVVTDNAGPELVADLILVDHLLRSHPRLVVHLHVKPQPYYISDATAVDVVAGVDRLGVTPVAGRLKAAAAAGRFGLRTHEFYCAPLGYDRMPADLAEQFASASVTVMKGDLNYRRLVGDRAWPVATPFADAVGYFPGPVAALRVLKSDVLVGVSADIGDGSWRSDGTRALVQMSAI